MKDQWQPIETLEEFKEALVYFPDFGVRQCYFKMDEGFKEWFVDDFKHGPFTLRSYKKEPTHWMPLPEGPKS